MANGKEKKKKEKHDQEDSDIKSDPETLNTTDPQEHMKGPISSLMKEVGESFDDKGAGDDKGAEKKSKEK